MRSIKDVLLFQHLPFLEHRESFQRRNKSCSALDLRKKTPPKKGSFLPSPTVEKRAHPAPGVLDDRLKKILEPAEKEATTYRTETKEIQTLPVKWEDKASKDDSYNKSSEDKENRSFLNSLDDHINRYERATNGKTEDKPIDFQKYQVRGSPDDLSPLGKKVKSAKGSRKSSGSSRKMVNGRSKAKSPIAAYPEFQIAKRFHEDNLKHHPLPDVIDDPVFKALESNKHPHPGIALKVHPNASAIGWKGYGVPGPTKCSKLKVFRPKTAAEMKAKMGSPRPKTTEDKKRSIKHFTQMDLAICWDLKPQDPSDEPKRSPHIDGSNGSAAPAVFAVVPAVDKGSHTPPKIMGSAQAVAEHIPRTTEDDNVGTLPSKIRPYTSPKVNPRSGHSLMRKDTSSSLNSISPKAADFARKNPKTAWTERDTSKAISEKLQELKQKKRSGSVDSKRKESSLESEINSLTMIKKKHYQSSPNLAEGPKCTNGNCNTPPKCTNGNCNTPPKCTNGNCNTPPEKRESKRRDLTRNCQACDRSDSDSEQKQKPEYKQAFKAGVPQAVNSLNSSNSGAKPVKMPKLRPPYSKRSYSIGTLAPPFSVWPDNHGQDYPEHWRLASVYQHSYKPVEQRRKHLLASVYQ